MNIEEVRLYALSLPGTTEVHWNDVFLDEIDGDMVKGLINQSYRLVLSKLPKRLRERYIIKQ